MFPFVFFFSRFLVEVPKDEPFVSRCFGQVRFWSLPQKVEEPSGIARLELEQESGSEAAEEEEEEEFDFEFFLGKDHPRAADSQS